MSDQSASKKTVESLVLRLSHWDPKVRQEAYDGLLSAGGAALPRLEVELSARDPAVRIAALDLCCRINPGGAREYARRVWLGDKNASAAAAVLECLGTYGDTVSDLCLVYDLVKVFEHPYIAFAGAASAGMIGRRLDKGEDSKRAAGLQPAPGERIQVLAVDDSRTARCFYRQVLEEAGPYAVDEAADGLEGLAACFRKKYGLLIVDINLPHMDGVTLIRELRQSEAYRNTPVIVISTEDEACDAASALSAGASAYLTKPVSPGELAELAGVLLQKKDS